MRRALFAALAAGALLASCFDQVAGGSGTSTDNVVTARLLLSVDSITRYLPPGDTGPYPLLVRLDSRHIDFAKHALDSAGLRFEQVADSAPLAFQLREWSPTAGFASAWVRIPHYRRGWGQYIAMRIEKDSTVSRSDAVAAWAGVSDSVRTQVATVLLADFDSSPGIPLLPCACDTWYASASAGGKLTLPAAGNPFTSAIQSSGTSRGKALHVSFTAKSPEWVLAGTLLGTGYHRFAGLDSITFWAKGSGIMHIALENGRDTSGYMKAWVGFYLDTGWTRHVIKPSQFDPQSYTGKTAGWTAVRDSISRFSVFGQDGSDFWIDDIRFHGLSPAEIP